MCPGLLYLPTTLYLLPCINTYCLSDRPMSSFVHLADYTNVFGYCCEIVITVIFASDYLISFSAQETEKAQWEKGTRRGERLTVIKIGVIISAVCRPCRAYRLFFFYFQAHRTYMYVWNVLLLSYLRLALSGHRHRLQRWNPIACLCWFASTAGFYSRYSVLVILSKWN